MRNTELGKFCEEHADWKELLIQEPYYLKIKEDGPYTMFSYDQIRSDFNISLVREARGIIFRTGEWKHPVCWAFDKFGNYAESYAPKIDWDTAFVTEKIDGSLMKVWWDGEWKLSTNGTIDAWKAELGDIRVPNFGVYFQMALKKYYTSFEDFVRGLETHRTYMFELVGPYNRVVVPYDEPDLYFLGARTNYSGEEFYCSELVTGALGLGRFKRPYQYSLTSLASCIKAAELKTWDDEGFVVVDAHGNRVKIKSPAYVLAHFMRNNNVITRKRIIKVILENETAEFLCYAAEYRDALLETQRLMKAFHNIGNRLAESCRTIMALLPRGDYARLVKTFPSIFQSLLFMNYERVVTAEEYTSKWNENKWEDSLTALEQLTQELLETNLEKKNDQPV